MSLMPKVETFRVDFKIQYKHKYDGSMKGSIPYTLEMLPSHFIVVEFYFLPNPWSLSHEL